MGEDLIQNNLYRTFGKGKNFKESMSVFNNRIKKEGGNPNSISNDVRMGLLDMDWQLGRNTFMNKYNNFWKAVANDDYEGMRKESRTTWKDKKGQYSIYCKTRKAPTTYW